ncbi:MAG: protease modulator HflC [Alphaproteobacteria bacterium]|nr:protease modulator HflC [Alphaproteobacteria bacterium]
MVKFLAGIIGVITIIVGTGALFTVKETEQVLVLQFGEVRRAITEPGLNIKIPMIQNIIRYDNRILPIDPPQFEVLLTDKKRVNVDAYARYKIIDASEFYQRVRTETLLTDRFGKNANAALQRVLATVSLTDMLSENRDNVMQQIEEELQSQAKTFGIELIDIRIGRTDLPSQTSEAVFNRMRTEREREARELRAQGEEASRKIRAQADKERTIILADAKSRSNILIGDGEAQRNVILGDAYGRDANFFAFYKSLEQYEQALATEDTTFVISPDSEFFEFFGKSR